MQIQQVIASFLASSSVLFNGESSESQEVSSPKEDFVAVDSNDVEILKNVKYSSNKSNHSNDTSSNAAAGVAVSNVGSFAVVAGLVAFLL